MTSLPSRLGWATDLHVNFVTLADWERFVAEVRDAHLDGLLVTGDISEAEDLSFQLRRMEAEIDVPIFFVLGNHDFYHGSIEQIRETVRDTSEQLPKLHYLTGAQPIPLAESWTLVGDDGWADARAGDYYQSPVRMNDFQLIQDLTGLDSKTRRKRLRREGAASAVRLHRLLTIAAQHSRQILVLTHVPPFLESCWYEGAHSDDWWSPFFVNHTLGWMLRRFCTAHPGHQITVLCGHTHHAGFSQIAKNLRVWTGAAEYGAPALCATLDLAQLNYPNVDWHFEHSCGGCREKPA